MQGGRTGLNDLALQTVFDEDFPMSDMSYVSSGFEGLITHHESETQGHADKSKTVQNFIVLPEDAVYDSAPEFSIAPIQPAKRALLSRTLPPTSFLSSQQPEKCQSPSKVQVGQPSARLNAGQQILQNDTDPVNEIDICLLPLNITKTCSKDVFLKSKDQKNTHQTTGSVVSKDDIQLCNQAESSNDTVGEHGKDNATTSLETRRMPDDNGAVEPPTPDGAVQEADSSTLDAVKTISDIHEPDSVRQCGTASKCSRQGKPTSYISSKEQHRVRKPRSIPHHSRQKMIGYQSDQESASDAREGPEEEDLLLLLMHRSEERKHTASRDSKRLNLLEEENKQLHAAKAALQETLDSVEADRTKLLKYADAAQIEQEQFQNKYKKLKTWALEMNNEYANIRQEGSNLKTALANIRQQNTEMWEPLQGTLVLNEKALATLPDIQKDLKEAQKSVQALDITLYKSQTTLAERKVELRTLKATELRQRSYIQDLCRSQKDFDKRTTSHQDSITKVLDTFRVKLETFELHPPRFDNLDECLNLVKQLSETCTSNSSDLNAMHDTMTGLVDRLKMFQNEVDTMLHAACDRNLPASLKDDVSSIKCAIDSLGPDLIKIQELQQANARLQEKVNGDVAIRKLVEEAKHTAENRYDEVQKNNDKLVESLTTGRNAEEESWMKVLDDARVQLNKAVLEKDTCMKELKQVKLQNESYINEVQDLKRRVANDSERFSCKEKETQCRYESRILTLEKAVITKEYELKSGFDEQLKSRDVLIETSMTSLQDVRRAIYAAKGEIRLLRKSREEIGQSFERMQQVHSTNIAEMKRQAVTTIQLNKNLHDFENIANQVPRMKSEITEKDGIIKDLQAEAKRTTMVQGDLNSSRAQLASQETTIMKLEQKLNSAEQEIREKNVLKQRLSQHREEVVALEQQLTCANKELTILNELRDSIKRRDADINQLRSLLEDTQKTCDKLKDAETKRQVLEERILAFELETHSLHEQILACKQTDCEKDSTIDTLQKQIAHNEQLEAELNDMRAQLGGNKSQIAEQRNTNIISAACRGTAQAAGHHSDSNLDKFFTQNTDLSISTPAVASNQANGNLLLQVPGSDVTTQPTQIQVVDPQAIMRSHPLIHPENEPKTTAVSFSQISVVPNSQLDIHTEPQHKDLLSRTAASESRQRTSSPLSGVNEGFLAETIEAYDADSEHASVRDNVPSQNDQNQSNIFDLPSTSPSYPARHRVSGLSRGSSSVISHDEMLLQASESGRQPTPHSHNVRDEHSRTGKVATRILKFRTQQDRLSLNGPHSDRPRTNPPDPKSLLVDIPVDTNSHDPAVGLREPNRPNSAIKRRGDHDPATEINGRSTRKRPKQSNPATKTSTAHNSETTNEVSPASKATENRSTTIRLEGSPGDGALGARKAAKKPRACRNRSKQDRYAERFGDIDQL